MTARDTALTLPVIDFFSPRNPDNAFGGENQWIVEPLYKSIINPPCSDCPTVIPDHDHWGVYQGSEHDQIGSPDNTIHSDFTKREYDLCVA